MTTFTCRRYNEPCRGVTPRFCIRRITSKATSFHKNGQTYYDYAYDTCRECSRGKGFIEAYPEIVAEVKAERDAKHRKGSATEAYMNALKESRV